MQSKRITLSAVLIAATYATSVANASVIYSGDLRRGDKFHLAFVTHSYRNAMSEDISDYNYFVDLHGGTVAEEHNGGNPATWRAIASTQDTNARDNIGEQVAPIYNTAGELVASDAGDLWSGNISNSISYTEEGELFDTYVWSGTTQYGQTSAALGSTYPYVGFSTSELGSWLYARPEIYAASYSFYGISSELTYVPEPTSATLLFVILGALRQRHRN